MKNFTIFTASVLLFFFLFSCKKDIFEPDINIEHPTDTTSQDQGNKPDDPVDPTDPTDPQPPMDKLVMIQPRITIGAILFDSIPAQLILKSWDAKNEMTYKIIYLTGKQPVYLSAGAVRFHLSVSKWGGYAERTLKQEEIKENDLYTIDLQLLPKKLKSVTQAKIVEGASKPLTKTDYTYDAKGEITKRIIWGKRADMSNYPMQTDHFTYVNGNITGIQSFDENDKPVKTLTALYDSQNRVIALEEIAGVKKNTAKASYYPLESGGDIKRHYRISVQYDVENGKYTDYYERSISAGKTFYDIYTSHVGGNEEGYYDYDTQINPYAHLRIPEMDFNQHDTHNRTFPRKHYGRERPEYEPYDYKYTYFSDGYPKEIMTKYRHTGSKMEAYTLRTVFTY